MQTQKTGDYFNTSVPLVSENHAIATLHLEQRAALDEQQVQEVAYDVMTVSFAAALATVLRLNYNWGENKIKSYYA